MDEKARLAALSDYHLMDTPAEPEFDRLAGLASRLFKVPIVLVSLLERDRQFFKSHIGLDVCETSREVSFCAHAIMQDDILVIPDATRDPRFASNPLVIGPPFIRFYAGKPLASPTGEKIGTVCLIDTRPRSTFSGADRQNLTDLAGLVMDRMEMKRLEHGRAASQERFEKIAATSPDAIICSNADGGVTFWNRSAERVFGYTQTEMLHRSSEILVPNSWHAIFDAEMQRLKDGEPIKLADRVVELSGLRKDGSEFPAEYALSCWKENGSFSVGAIIRDITERRQHEERLFKLASLDALTDLPNRTAWQERLNNTLAAGIPLSVLLIDLDGFKDVNDTFGHSVGDAVLQHVASCLKAICRDALKIARLGGDEFVVLLAGHDERLATALATTLISAICEPYEFAGLKTEIGASIGISFAPQHGQRGEELLGAADLALYRAKASGKGRFCLFEPQFREVAVARRAFEKELRAAFENGEFELFYQPQFSIATRRLTGAEALIRWNHPQRGLLTPASFIDVLAQKPSAPAIGEWILRSACQQAAVWRNKIPEFRVGVNLFDAQLRSDGLLGVIDAILSENGLSPDGLELELVENIFLKRDAHTLRLLGDIRRLGVGLALDDYGTGFASLSLLKEFPLSRLKIDRAFVQSVNTHCGDAAVVKAILHLAEAFGLDVIAEGIETEAQLDFLREHGCQEAQGYLFGKPMPAAEFSARFVAEPAGRAQAVKPARPCYC